MNTLELILQIGLLILLGLNIVKEIFWGKRQKEYYESTSAKSVLPQLDAMQELLTRTSSEREKLQIQYKTAQKEIKSLKKAYMAISSGAESIKEFEDLNKSVKELSESSDQLMVDLEKGLYDLLDSRKFKEAVRNINFEDELYKRLR